MFQGTFLRRATIALLASTLAASATGASLHRRVRLHQAGNHQGHGQGSAVDQPALLSSSCWSTARARSRSSGRWRSARPTLNVAMGWKKTSVKRGDVVTMTSRRRAMASPMARCACSPSQTDANSTALPRGPGPRPRHRRRRGSNHAPPRLVSCLRCSPCSWQVAVRSPAMRPPWRARRMICSASGCRMPLRASSRQTAPHRR